MEVTMAIKKRGWKCVNPECASSEFGEAVMNPDGSMDCKACGQRVERFEYFVDEACQDCGASADLFCHCFCCGMGRAAGQRSPGRRRRHRVRPAACCDGASLVGRSARGAGSDAGCAASLEGKTPP